VEIILDFEAIELLNPVRGLEKNPLIYALLDPNTNEIRYIGKSLSGIDRPRSHTAPSNLKQDGITKKSSWLKSLIKKNQKPVIKIIEYFYYENLDRETINEILYLKEQKLIKLFKDCGFDLTNGTDGGPGAPNRIVSEETRKKMSDSAKKAGLNSALLAQQKHKLPPNTETHKFCGGCRKYVEFKKFTGKQAWCKACKNEHKIKSRKIKINV
jgi:NADH pyrophosphatase NudC (nudix superfamily)